MSNNYSTHLKVKGNRFVHESEDVFLKSVGLGNWLNIEHFMLGIPGTSTQIQKMLIEAYGENENALFWEQFLHAGISDADIRYIASRGFNSVRIPINHHLFGDAPSFAESTAVRHIDRILSLCEQNGLWAILDLHTVDGGQNPDWHSDNAAGDYLFWKKDLSKSAISLWGQIAAYYKNSRVVAGYDLLNEPCYLDKEYDDALFSYYVEATKKIRQIDKEHILFYEGNTYARDFTMFPYNPDENVAYSFHFYPFLQLSKNVNDKQGFPARIEAQLERDVSVSHVQQKLNKPFWCGETGHPHHAPDTMYMRDCFLEVLENKGISWSLWTYKDTGCMGLVTQKENSRWNKKMRDLSENWNFFDFFQQDSALAVSLEKNKMDYYKKLAAFSTDAFNRFQNNLHRTSIDELHSMLTDFEFKNCVIRDSL